MLAECTLSEEIRHVDQSHRFKNPHFGTAAHDMPSRLTGPGAIRPEGSATCPPHSSRLLTAETIALRHEISVSVASSGAISQVAPCAILQTSVLPTELPRREPHFTRSGGQSRANNGVGKRCAGASNGLRALVLRPAKPLLAGNCDKDRNHCSSVNHARVARSLARRGPCTCACSLNRIPTSTVG